MFCSECGNRLENAPKFCPSCGSKTASNDSAPNQNSQVIDLNSQEAVNLFNLGLEAGQEGRHLDAIDHFKLLALSGDLQAAENMGYSLYQIGKFDDAEEWLDLAAEGGYFRAASAIGTDAYKDKDFESARRWFQISAKAGDVNDQGALALLCIQAKDFECAQKWWTQIVAENSPDHQDIVEEARNNLRALHSDPEYVVHMLGKRK